jgi:cell division protein FtsZ
MRPNSPNGNAQPQDPDFRIKVIGVGGAGSNALDRLLIEGSVNVDLVACNTDVQALAGSVASQKIQLGRRVTRGLGAGGDPELGFAAAEEAAAEIRGILEGVPLVIVCAGLGGGTGSGAAPYIVRMAREQNSLVLVCATLPFSLECRRAQQAQEALGVIQQYADAVMCFENDRMGELSASGSGIHDAFAGADRIISQSVRAIIDLVMRRGLIHLGFDDLLSALRSNDSRCLFGYGEASGGYGRGKEALEEALRNPLMDRGSPLSQSANVLVNIVGGEDLTLAEVQAVMEELAQHIGEQTQLLFGAAVDPKLEGRLGVTLISSLGARVNGVAEAVPARPMPVARPVPAPMPPPSGAPSAAAAAAYAESTPVAAKAAAPMRAAAAETTAEPTVRGRFDKSEPTIVDGEDLDVPTFMRKNMKVK